MPKSGKTTTASRFPNSLLIAFEKGYNALPGVYAQPVNSWGEFKKLFTEFKSQAVKDKFSTLVLDTADIMYSYCEKFICGREGVSNVGDIPYGKGYALVGAEFDESIRTLLQLGYGVVLISHSTDKVFKDTDGNEYNQIVPTLDKRARLICERTCDIIGFSTVVKTSDGASKTKLFLRETPRYVAGSRFRYLVDSIDFTYDNLVNAIADAIDKEAKATNGEFVTNTPTQVVSEVIEYDFDKLVEDFQNLVGEVMAKGESNAIKITAIVDKYLGKGNKVSECTPEQGEQIDLINFELRNLL